MANRYSIVIGSLLHDIGKFKLRAMKPGSGKTHMEIGAEWLKEKEKLGLDPSIKMYAQWHHKDMQYDNITKSNKTLIVSQADHLSSQSDKIEKDTDEFDYHNTPLMSIFSRITLNGNLNKEYRFYKIDKIGNTIMSPEVLSNQLANQELYQSLWKSFESEFDQLLHNGLTVENLTLLLEKFCSTIPSELQCDIDKLESYPDISLFDHMRTVAAFSDSLENFFIEDNEKEYREKNLEKEIQDGNKPYFLIVGGDFSGVQNFIYTISSSGALKTLRARSFFLELLTEHIVSEILEALSLTKVNVIYSGGGRFFLLTQNTEKAKKSIDHIVKIMNSWLFDQFNGKLYLIASYADVNSNDLFSSNISQVWSRLGEKLSKLKGQKFKEKLHSMLLPKEPKLPEHNCAICYRDDIDPDTMKKLPNETIICRFCYDLYVLGDNLTDAKYLIKTQTASDDTIQIINKDKMYSYYKIVKKIQNINKEDLKKLYVLNSWDINDYFLPITEQMLYGNYVRKVGELPESGNIAEEAGNKATASFAGLAASSRVNAIWQVKCYFLNFVKSSNIAL
jgi:CRISPR-associated protein Csm1